MSIQRASLTRDLKKYFNVDVVGVIYNYIRKLNKEDKEFKRIRINILGVMRRIIGKDNKQIKTKLSFRENVKFYSISITFDIKHFSIRPETQFLFQLNRENLNIKIHQCLYFEKNKVNIRLPNFLKYLKI